MAYARDAPAPATEIVRRPEIKASSFGWDSSEGKVETVVTCVLRYEIDSNQIVAFEAFARTWIDLVRRLGGTHHGYFLPSEGASDIALALFSFPSLAEYEVFRSRFSHDPEIIETQRVLKETGCVRRVERTFMRPVLAGTAEPGAA